jgi:hypothetical protein
MVTGAAILPPLRKSFGDFVELIAFPSAGIALGING